MAVDKADLEIQLYLIVNTSGDRSYRSHGRVWKYKGIAKVDGKMADAEWSATIVDRK